MATRDELDAVLKEVFVPALRVNGFQGSLPHFRRRKETQIDLLSFQHSQPSGGKFVIEIAKAPPVGITTSWGKHISPSKVKVHDISVDLFRNRLRLGSSPDKKKFDHWFDYSMATPIELNALVSDLIDLVEQQGEVWWNDGYLWWNSKQ